MFPSTPNWGQSGGRWYTVLYVARQRTSLFTQDCPANPYLYTALFYVLREPSDSNRTFGEANTYFKLSYIHTSSAAELVRFLKVKVVCCSVLCVQCKSYLEKRNEQLEKDFKSAPLRLIKKYYQLRYGLRLQMN